LDCDGLAVEENVVVGVAEETVGVDGGEDMASRHKGAGTVQCNSRASVINAESASKETATAIPLGYVFTPLII
jgi:hypothetical protein